MLFFIRYFLQKLILFTLINPFIINNLSYIFSFYKISLIIILFFIDSKNKLGNTLSKRFLICYGRNTLVKKTYKIQCANDESPYAQYPGFNFCR